MQVRLPRVFGVLTVGRSLWIVGLATVLGIALVAPPPNWADDVINLQFHSFQDSRGVTVLAPTVDLQKDFTDRTGLKVKFGVDGITAASDSCARCHGTQAHNARTYVDFSLLRKYGDFKLEVGGEVSRERFYAADTGMVSISRDLNKGNTTIAAGYSFSFNRPVLHPTQDVAHQVSQDVVASVTQTLTKTTIMQVSFDYNRISGYQSSPFLRAKVNTSMLLGIAPDLRTRRAISARIRQALPAETYLEADYRRYTDSWSLSSNTVSLGLSHYFTPGFMAAVNYRWYDQTGAFFYQPQYVGNPQFFTADYKLAPFNSGLYGGRMSYTPSRRLFMLPARTSFEFGYQRYLASTNFKAAMFSAGLRIPF